MSEIKKKNQCSLIFQHFLSDQTEHRNKKKKTKIQKLPADKELSGRGGGGGHKFSWEELCFRSGNGRALCDRPEVSAAVLLRILLLLLG